MHYGNMCIANCISHSQTKCIHNILLPQAGRQKRKNVSKCILKKLPCQTVHWAGSGLYFGSKVLATTVTYCTYVAAYRDCVKKFQPLWFQNSNPSAWAPDGRAKIFFEFDFDFAEILNFKRTPSWNPSPRYAVDCTVCITGIPQSLNPQCASHCRVE